MELSKNYEPQSVEQKWYAHWNEQGYFNSTPDERPAYTIVMPPPNVTGVLHMGHALNNTVQDILLRRAKMQGYNTCWVPGTDHASIATEAKVVQMLREIRLEEKPSSKTPGPGKKSMAVSFWNSLKNWVVPSTGTGLTSP
jgi:valyl-tRNA synthetase